MAIITWDDDGSQYYVPDTLLYAGDPEAAWKAAIPVAKFELLRRLDSLKSQLTTHFEPSDDDLLAWAKQTHNDYIERRRVEAQIASAEEELKQWP